MGEDDVESDGEDDADDDDCSDEDADEFGVACLLYFFLPFSFKVCGVL